MLKVMKVPLDEDDINQTSMFAFFIHVVQLQLDKTRGSFMCNYPIDDVLIFFYHFNSLCFYTSHDLCDFFHIRL